MESENIVCPVCTLYLRPGITLKQHLSSHPKQKVIDALVNLTNSRGDVKEVAVMNSAIEMGSNNSHISQHQWTQPVTGFPPMPTPPGNHSFIYQQFMSTTSQPPHVVSVNPLGQQYITIPTVFNPQMMCQPYLYHQQQQVIMSAGTTAVLPPMIRKPPVIDLSEDCEESQNKDVLTVEDDLPINNFEPLEEPKDEDKDLVDETINLTNAEASLMDDVAMLNTEHEIKSDDELDEEESDKVAEEEEKLDEEEDRLADEEEEEGIGVEEDEGLRDGEEDEKKEEDIEEMEQIDQVEQELEHIEENLGSPASSDGSDYLRVRTDLNKACQTQVPQINLVDNEPEDMEEEMYFSTQAPESPSAASPKIVAVQERDLSNIMQQSDQIIDMDGMQLVLCNDFMGSQLISQVEDFECINNRNERTVLMNIGGMDGGFANTFNESNVNMDELAEESISRDESTNMSIRADEHMPPRGELSGQESNGAASDITWTRIHYEVNSATSTSYDLIAQETWDGSNCSDSEATPTPVSAPPKEDYNPDLDDTPTIVSVIEPPLNFKCPTCGKGFKCPKERKEHQNEAHGDRSKADSSAESNSDEKATNNVIGSKLGKKQVKKLVIKPKKATEIKSENNFDNVFTNKIKPDNLDENKVEKVESRMSVIAAVTSECDLEDKKEKYCICHICEAVLPDNRALKRHKVHSHGKTFSTRFKCDICEENLQTEKKYNEHLRKHPLECRLCGKYFYRRPNLQLHMKRHLGIRPHCCDFCQKSFLTKQKLDEHKNVHTGEAPIKCNMCDETFKRHSNLVQHRNRHHLNIKHKVKDYICFCGEILHSKKKLAWHKEIHDAKPKACAHCSEKFVHMASLTRHMRRAHNERFVPKEERVSENVECPICKGVYLKSSLDVHMRKHSGQRPYGCLICNKDFTTKWNLKLHKWTHAARASKPFKCDQCKGAFIRESDYIAHMNSHKSIRPYTCNHCGAQFIRKYNCQRHVKEHENAKTFACQICGKSFHRSYYLKDHMKVHSGVRPYSCHICGKTSTTKSNHNKHVMIHHAKEPVSTEN